MDGRRTENERDVDLSAAAVQCSPGTIQQEPVAERLKTQSEVQVSPAAAVRAFKSLRGELMKAVVEPLVLANDLYSKNIVPQQTKDRTALLTLTKAEKNVALLDAIEARLQTNPSDFGTLIAVLEADSVLQILGTRLRKACCTNLLECSESESNESECGQEDDSPGLDVKVNNWRHVPLAVAIVAISVLYLLPPSAVPVHYYSHREYLQRLYLREVEDVPDDQWPLVKKLAYVRLAMVNLEREGDTVKDKFLRKTLLGSAGNILHQRMEIQFHQMFEFEKGSSGARILIEGRPGSGKTTLMRKITREWVNGSILSDCAIFVLVPLRRLPNKDQDTLEDLVGIAFPRKKVKDLVSEIEEMEGLGVCFALDGVDEHVAAASETGYVYKLFEGIELSKSCVIMTSRPSATIPFRKLASRYIEVIGFMSEEINQYIAEYYHDQPEKSHLLPKYLNNHLNIKYMCYLPVNLAIIVWLFDKLEPGGSLPDRETDIYESFTINSLVRHMQTKDDTKRFAIGALSEIEKLSDARLSLEKKESFSTYVHLHSMAG